MAKAVTFLLFNLVFMACLTLKRDDHFHEILLSML